VKLIFRQSGGITGLIRGCELDTDALPPSQGRRLQQLLDACDLQPCDVSTGPSDARDATTYRLCLERPEGVVQVACDEAALPAGFEPLIDFLQEFLGPRVPD
jgi:hypothetical protein